MGQITTAHHFSNIICDFRFLIAAVGIHWIKHNYIARAIGAQTCSPINLDNRCKNLLFFFGNSPDLQFTSSEISKYYPKYLTSLLILHY